MNTVMKNFFFNTFTRVWVLTIFKKDISILTFFHFSFAARCRIASEKKRTRECRSRDFTRFEMRSSGSLHDPYFPKVSHQFQLSSISRCQFVLFTGRVYPRLNVNLCSHKRKVPLYLCRHSPIPCLNRSVSSESSEQRRCVQIWVIRCQIYIERDIVWQNA